MMTASVLKPSFKVAVSRPAVTARATRRVVVRASTEEPKPEVENKDSTVFMGGNSYTNEEWKEAVATGQVKPAPQNPTPAAAGQAMSLTTAFNFDQAPELMNGRLAMLAFVAALGAELSSGESVLRQFAETPTAVIFTAVTFTVASLIPMLSGVKRESFGPFTPGAEMTNGRAAMLGFAALILVEVVRGKALF